MIRSLDDLSPATADRARRWLEASVAHLPQDYRDVVRDDLLGAVRIGDDVELGANTCVDRGALDDTVIGNGVKIDNQIQIAHNVVIGDHSALAGCVGIAGSTRIGRRCTVGGAGMIVGHLEIGDDVHVSAGTMVTKNLRQPGQYTSIYPLETHDEWLHNAAQIKRLAKLAERVSELEEKLELMEKKI